MNNALIIDGALLVILLLGCLIGAKRGLFKSLMGVIVLIAAMIGAAVAADMLTGPVTDFMMPRIGKAVMEWLGVPEGLTMGGPFSGMLSSNSAINPGFSGWLDMLERWSIGGRFAGQIRDSMANAAQAAARTLVESIVHSILMLVCFIILLIALKLLVRTVDHIFDLPVLDTLNRAGGGIFGLLEAVLLVYLALWLVPRSGAAFLRANAKNTYLLKFFLTYTPFAIIASLNGGK